ncbi:hypothetical protein GCK72_007345 [Caenorhabditis remanei]|uniref:Uncharacterized protein n=1 Tax=Caenorhabditis remanei TaxID=31234 RepID=A0A6A5HL30_CAERE|nr:hypothetical protein GCK72_007345 [Caenorhabditis remanei]KAF1767386.1 hypothetical protein GCK72_007345 [Caenorhabditis remanei]
MWTSLYDLLAETPNWRNLPIREINAVLARWGPLKVRTTTNNRKYKGVLKLWEMTAESIFGRDRTIQDDLEEKGFLVVYPRDRVVFVQGMGVMPIQFVQINIW